MKTVSRRLFTIVTVCIITLLLNGCFGSPRMRMGCLPTSTPGGSFLNPERLGPHSYGYGGALFERDGIVYTCKAGHVDVTHLRWNADYAKYLAGKIEKTVMRDKKGFSFRIVLEQSQHVIRFEYPDSWVEMPEEEKAQAARRIALMVGPYIAYTATTWHEIATFYGTHYVGFEPEANSAFSWEDSFSNLLGTHLAVRAMLDEENSYNKAMAIVLDEEMERLGVRSRKDALEAAEKMRGEWFNGNFFVETTMKNFDIGLDGSVTPTLVPEAKGCETKPVRYQVFTTDILDEYGIKMTYQIKPNIFEAGKIYKAIGNKDVYPARDYPLIMEDIKRRAIEKGYQFDE